MATATLTGHEVEVYTGEVITAYSLTDMFPRDWSRWRGMVPAEVLNQPVITPGLAKHFDDDQDHINQDATLVSAEIPLFVPLKAMNRLKYDTIDVRPDLNLLREFGEAHGISIGEGKTIRLLNFLAKAADTAGNVIEINGGLEDPVALSAEIKGAYEDAASNMDELKVTDRGRKSFLKSRMFYKLAGSNDVMSKDFGSGAANRATVGGNMATLNYINIDIKNIGLGFGVDWTFSDYDDLALPEALEFDMSNVLGVVWQRDSWMLREQVMPMTSIDALENLQVWQILARYKFGVKELQTDGIWVIKDENSNS